MHAFLDTRCPQGRQRRWMAQPMLATCRSGPLPVNVIWRMALRNSELCCGTAHPKIVEAAAAVQLAVFVEAEEFGGVNDPGF